MSKNNTTKEDFSDVIDQVKLIENIKPQKDWVLFCRSNLEMRMRLEHKKELINNDISILEDVFSFLKIDNNASVLSKIAYAFSIVFIILTAGAGLTAWAATKSMPGSPLYRIKIAMEEVRVTIASQAEKDKLHTEMAGRRIEELRVVLDSSGTNQDKKEQVTKVVGQLQQQLNNDKDQLPKVRNSQESSIAAVKEVVDRAQQVKKAIIEAKESLPADIDTNLKDKLADVTDAADKNSLQALGSMIAKSDKTDNDNKEIMALFNEIIAGNELSVDKIAQKSTYIQATSTADRFPINAVLVNQSDQARELIDKAKISLENNDFSVAFDNLNALNQIVKGAERIVESSDFNKELESSQIDAKADNSSTTEPVLEGQ